MHILLRTITLLLAVVPAAHAAPAPSFTDPVALVAWLLAHSAHGFDPLDDAASAPVLSPGLRVAIRSSLDRSARRKEPPCGANGDIIRDSQEDGTPQNVRLSVGGTSTERRTVSVSYEVDGHHRSRRFLVVLLQGAWKVEGIAEAEEPASTLCWDEENSPGDTSSLLYEQLYNWTEPPPDAPPYPDLAYSDLAGQVQADREVSAALAELGYAVLPETASGSDTAHPASVDVPDSRWTPAGGAYD